MPRRNFTAGVALMSEPTWDRVHVLFHEALELGPEARQEFLERIMKDDPALGSQVRSLLDAHENAGDFLDSPPLIASAASLAPGERLGPYRIVQEIGRGGMGVVYRAVRDDEHFQKEVAIKVIEPGMRSEGILKRFRDERQILAMLDHPHIARILDGGSAPDGGPYLVMEHVTGRPLLEYSDEHRLGVDERLELFLTVCDAVQFAHQYLVVHRDLKSDNILVTDDGSPRLLDFGIARVISDESGVAATVTAPMHRMLTPDYASQEQVRGEPVTVASDVYSLGVILYELLTGTRPLRFETRTPEEILRVVTQDEPSMPSAAVARTGSPETASLRGATVPRLRHRLAGDLDYILLKALEKDPARRYGSVDQLARDIRRHLDKLPVLARGRTTAYLFSRLVRRHRVAFVTGGLVTVALLVGLVGTTWQAYVAGVERDRAKARFEDVRALAHAVVFDIHDAIANLPGSTKAREILVTHALHYLDNLSHEAAGDPLLQDELAIAYGKIGDVQGRPMFPNLGRTEDAMRSYRRSIELFQAALAARPESLNYARDMIITMQRLGDVLQQMGRKGEALRLEEEAKQRIVAARAIHPENVLLMGDFGVAVDRLADMKAAAGDTLGAIAESAEGIGLIEDVDRRNPGDINARRNLMVGYAKMARLLASAGLRDSADADYRRSQELALECVQALPNNTDAIGDLGIVYGMRAMFLAQGGQVDSALALYAKSMKIAEGLAAADPNDALQQTTLATGHYEIGTILMKGRRYREAGDRFDEAYRRSGMLAARDTSNADARTLMARSSRQAGEACRAMAAGAGAPGERSRWRAKAMGWYRRSLDLYRALEGAGALAGEDLGASASLTHALAELGGVDSAPQGVGGSEPESSR